MPHLRLFRLLVFAAMLTGVAGAQSTNSAFLLALSKQAHTLAIIDPVTLKIVATVYPLRGRSARSGLPGAMGARPMFRIMGLEHSTP